MAESMSAEATVAVTVGCAVPGLFGFFCPAVLEVGGHDRQAVRLQQAKASVASLVLGAAGSVITRTPWPFLLAAALIGLLMWEYESAHRRGGEIA